jgi:hypothetical protein
MLKGPEQRKRNSSTIIRRPTTPQKSKLTLRDEGGDPSIKLIVHHSLKTGRKAIQDSDRTIVPRQLDRATLMERRDSANLPARREKCLPHNILE